MPSLPLKTRLLAALSLTCALAPGAACKRSDDVVGSVESEVEKHDAKKPSPEPKPKTSWSLDEPGAPRGRCTFSRFCTTQPVVVHPSGAGAEYEECGLIAKVPKAIALVGFEDARGSFDPIRTEKQRKEAAQACCYSYPTGPCGEGRPLRAQGAPVLAREGASSGWASSSEFEALARTIDRVASPRERAALIEHLRRVALLEHASVAAFGWVSVELLSLGAPSALVEAAHAAAADEIRHARACWSLLAALEGEARGPGAMTLPAFSTEVDVEQVLVTTIVDGCVGETLGSLLFEEASRRCTLPELAALYAVIAAEEARHAELAFRIVAFLVAERPALAERLVSIAARAEVTLTPTPRVDALGLLDRPTQRAVVEAGRSDVVLPVLATLAATHAPAAA